MMLLVIRSTTVYLLKSVSVRYCTCLGTNFTTTKLTFLQKQMLCFLTVCLTLLLFYTQTLKAQTSMATGVQAALFHTTGSLNSAYGIEDYPNTIASGLTATGYRASRSNTTGFIIPPADG